MQEAPNRKTYEAKLVNDVLNGSNFDDSFGGILKFSCFGQFIRTGECHQ